MASWLFRIFLATLPNQSHKSFKSHRNHLFAVSIAALKRIVLRDFEACFWCHAYKYGVGSFAVKISISCRIFRFSCLGIVRSHCERSWDIRLSAATVVAPYIGAQGGAHTNVVLAE
jgi:hypothetical protein